MFDDDSANTAVMNYSINNCTNQYPSLETLYSELSFHKGIIVLTALCGILVASVVVIYFEVVWFILVRAKINIGKKKVIFLVGIYPMMALTSLLILLFPVTTLIVEILSSLYLAICIWLFIQLIIDYFGGTENLMISMTGEKLSFGTPPLCCICRRCLKDCPFTRKTFGLARLFVLQVTFVRPIALTVPLLSWTQGLYVPGEESDPRNCTFYSYITSTVSSLISVWGLVVIHSNTIKKLEGYSMRSKFASLQLVILLSSLQFTIVNQLAKSGVIPCDGSRGPLIRGIRMHHLLLIFEVFFISLLARFAYRRNDPQNKYNSLQ